MGGLGDLLFVYGKASVIFRFLNLGENGGGGGGG